MDEFIRICDKFTNKKIFKRDVSGALLKDRDGNLTKINYDNAMKVGVIDYGVGNLGSVLRALEELRVTPVLVNRAVDMHANDCLILPGVGQLRRLRPPARGRRLVESLRDEVRGYSRPLLGVCVGMQLLADQSTEG